jgi:hypothetical protein
MQNISFSYPNIWSFCIGKFITQTPNSKNRLTMPKFRVVRAFKWFNQIRKLYQRYYLLNSSYGCRSRIPIKNPEAGCSETERAETQGVKE